MQCRLPGQELLEIKEAVEHKQQATTDLLAQLSDANAGLTPGNIYRSMVYMPTMYIAPHVINSPVQRIFCL